MNTKKNKNKNKHKPIPTPQKVEVQDEKVVPITQDTSEILEKSEERVPEIISEVVVTTTVESKSSEGDTPKKPKRNRGKKKKSEKDDGEQEQKSSEPAIEVIKDLSETKVEEEMVIKKEEEVPGVTPTARKKKNKNKKNTDQSIEEQKPIEQDEKNVQIKTDVKSETQIFVEEDKLELLTLPTELSDQETKTSKKRNKKKKRNDSEKSDKGEEAIACTTIFQKLLEFEDEKSVDSYKNISEENKMPLVADNKVIQYVLDEVKTDSKIVSVLESNVEAKDSITNVDVKPIDADVKSKKKNKTDNTYPGSIKTKDNMQKPSKSNTEPIIEEKASAVSTNVDVPTQIMSEAQTIKEKNIPEIEKEKNPKQKAKIPKTINKKGKEKSSDQNVEYFEEHAMCPKIIPPEEKLPPVACETLILKEPSHQKEGEKPDGTQILDSTADTENELSNVVQIKKIDVPETELRKKRKKSPKPRKHTETNKSDEDVKSELTESHDDFIDKEKEEVLPTLQTFVESDHGNVLSAIPSVQEVKDTKISKTIDQEKLETTQMLDSTVPQTKNIDVPETELRKKRKKSPKPRKHTETKKSDEDVKCALPESHYDLIDKEKEEVLPTLQTFVETEDCNVLGAISSIQEVKDTKISQTIGQKKKSHKTEDVPTPIFSVPIALLEQIDPEGITDATKQVSIAVHERETQKTQIRMPESEPGKKKKKSPKLPKKHFVIDSKQEIELKITKSDDDMKETSSEDKENTDSLPDLPPLEDIEISTSGKAEESAGSPCDIVPDVHYPRARSQLLDDNNNMITIQDISTTGEVKLNISVDIPYVPMVQDSGETPKITPELVSTGIRVTELDIEIPKVNEEKTDLKSKVMEVNKDMEDLRLSIERSLAELTAMEISEKNCENQFEEPHVHFKGLKETSTKDSSHCSKDYKEMPTEQLGETNIDPQDTVRLDTSNKIVLPDQKLDVLETKPKKMVEKSIELTKSEDTGIKSVTEDQKLNVSKHQKDVEETTVTNIEERKIELKEAGSKDITKSATEDVRITESPTPPVLPSRKDHKGKSKGKKKGKQDVEHQVTTSASTSEYSTNVTKTSETKDTSKETKKDEKSEQQSDTTKEKGKQQSTLFIEDNYASTEHQDSAPTGVKQTDFEPIRNFEDALTSSADDVNKTFEIIANESNATEESTQNKNNPEINITAPVEDDDKEERQERENPVSQPKNLLGHPDIPARLNKNDYKKDKNKTPNMKQAKVKIKDVVPIECNKKSKESQTEIKTRILKDRKSIDFNDTITSMSNENEEYVYKYSFRKVFLPSACHICKKEFKQARVPCNFCNLVFYCSHKHKDEDYPKHQALCFAVSTIVHLKDQKHMYADAKDITGHNYRLLRMQMIVACEKVLKRKLIPWEQEALLYPRICVDTGCREWRQMKLIDCKACGQISYCSDNPDHLLKSHQRWCKSYSLYQKLVCYQQTQGRLEPKLPSRVMPELCQIPEKMNEVLASLYEEKIDMNDIQYAALTQIATAPLTAVFSQQLYTNKMNSSYANGVHKKSAFTIHVVGAELQFEADALNKWEVFFLHLRPDVKELRIVLIGTDLNPSNLPLDVLRRITLCEDCRLLKRRVVFDFQDKKTYSEYWSTDFCIPDLVCAFNPSIQRSSIYNGKDTWPSTINCILKLKVPFLVTSYTINELQRDLARIKECAEAAVNTISEAKLNTFASVRPDRNFISDDEIPLLFKNYCFMVVCGAF